MQNNLNEISIYKEKPCRGSPTEGLCDMEISGYTYDIQSKKCKQFDEGGCGKTNNGFSNKEECDAKCGNLQAYNYQSKI